MHSGINIFTGQVSDTPQKYAFSVILQKKLFDELLRIQSQQMHTSQYCREFILNEFLALSLNKDIETRAFDDYDEGMKYAEKNNLPVLVDFTGYGCVNCRKMESAVFDTERIQKVLGENYVLITLVVDDRKQLETPYVVNENGKDVLIETVGDKWSYLQRHKFQANSQPYYIVLDNEGLPLTTSRAYDPAESVDAFETWLLNGVEAYKNNK